MKLCFIRRLSHRENVIPVQPDCRWRPRLSVHFLVSFSAPTWSLILWVCVCVCVGVSLDGRLMSLLETLQAALQMKWHTSDCVWAHMPVKLGSQTWEQGEREEMDEGNKSGGVKEAEEEAWGGTDGIGATVAEPLPLIAAPDKEKYQIGNQSCGLRGFEIFWWTMDWSTCLSVRLSLRGQMGFWQSSGGWYER